MDAMLRRRAAAVHDANFYGSAEYRSCNLCHDNTVPAGWSTCWRVMMLASDFTLAPIGEL